MMSDVNTVGASRESSAFDVRRVRRDFPILGEKIHGHDLVYLDSAASAQKPRAVLDAVTRLYETSYANVHRGVHELSTRATEAYEGARERVRAFLNAREASSIVFTRGATEAINLVASSWGGSNLSEGDEIVLSVLEHHSNIVPWQLIAERTGAKIRVVPVDDDGNFRLDELEALVGPRTKLVAVTHVSNAIGTIVPIAEVVRIAHAAGTRVLIDGCQAAPHFSIDVDALDVDFYAFSGHKVYGPTGIGALYAKPELLEEMPPYQGGGEMINRVTFEKTTFAKPPAKFEAGTPAIAQAAGLAAAIDYMDALGHENIARHEADLLAYATERLGALNSIQIIGQAAEKASILSFTMEGVHAHDIGTIVDHEGVAVRVGHHCAQPLMDRFGVASTARASFAVYNTREDVDRLVDALRKVQELFA